MRFAKTRLSALCNLQTTHCLSTSALAIWPAVLHISLRASTLGAHERAVEAVHVPRKIIHARKSNKHQNVYSAPFSVRLL